MSLDLIISSKPDEDVIALLKDKKLIEIHTESKEEDKTFAAGDIFLGKVKRTNPGLNAAFVNVGYEKDGFLHYSDLGASYKSFEKAAKIALNGKPSFDFKIEPEIDKYGKIKDFVSANQKMLVQVTKEPISSKGPKVTTEITLPGRYLVLIPFSNKISVSQKIEDAEEKNRLTRLIESIRPKNFGVIIRTVAQNRKVAELNQDLQELNEKWLSIYQKVKDVKPPKKILGELNRASAIVRDLLNETFNSIVVDDEIMYIELKEYIGKIAPDRTKIIKLHKGNSDVFQAYGIHKQIKGSFGRKVDMQGGGYLIIDHAEAMHVIDVNSGNRKGKENDAEANALQVNMAAAEEVARVLRLRDMGGIIAVDFIDMYNNENNMKLYKFLKEKMSTDRAKHNLIPPSKFGVIEITRQRLRPATEIETKETCPTCHGTGEVQAAILITDQIKDAIKSADKTNGLVLQVHPFVEAYFKKGLISRQLKWFFQYKKWIKIEGKTAKHLLYFDLKNKKGEEL
ncbi:MAG: Rne/Rng family ribonuclease [Flavobacteriales bacterium]